MSIVSATGIGSGIDINSLVTQLVKAEGQPALNAIQRQQDAANTRLSALGTLKSALSDFQAIVAKLKDGSLFSTHKTTSSDESILKVSAGAGSVAGSYGIEVVQLAKAQKSITAAEFANASEVVGTGSLTFSSGSGASFNVTVDDSNNSLSGLRDAINRAEGNSFVTASIVNVDSIENPGTTISRLVLTAKNTGVANAFTVTGTDSDGVDDGSGLSQLFTTQLTAQTAAKDAIIKVDGQTATRSTNAITDVIQGVTLDLQSEKVGSTVNVNISLDNEAVAKTITDFVTAYNKLQTTTKSLGKYGGNADGSGNGALLGDSTLRYVTSQVRQDASNTVSSVTGDYNALSMIGVKIDKDGVMSLDSTQLNKALSADLQSVSDVFSSSDGVAVRLHAKVTSFLQSGGPLDSQQTSLKKRLSDLEERKADVQARLDNMQKALQKQFTAMDLAVGQFNSTGTFLSNWIGNLNK